MPPKTITTFTCTQLLAELKTKGFNNVFKLHLETPVTNPNCLYVNMTLINGANYRIQVVGEKVTKGVQPFSVEKAADVAAEVNAKRKGDKKPIDAGAFRRQGAKATFTIAKYLKAPPVLPDEVTIVPGADLGATSSYYELISTINEAICDIVGAALDRGDALVDALKAAPATPVAELRAKVGSVSRNDTIIDGDIKVKIGKLIARDAAGAAEFFKELSTWVLIVPSAKLVPMVQTEFSDKSGHPGEPLPNPTTRPTIPIDDKDPSLPLGKKFGKTIGIFDLGKATYGPSGKPTSVPAATVGGAPLSGNQRTRLLLARALVQRPRLLLLDELFDGLDPESFRQLAPAIFDKSLPWTVIVTTRDHDVTKLCDQIIEIAPCHLTDGTAPIQSKP